MRTSFSPSAYRRRLKSTKDEFASLRASQAAQQASGEALRGAVLGAKFWRVGIQISIRFDF